MCSNAHDKLKVKLHIKSERVDHVTTSGFVSPYLSDSLPYDPKPYNRNWNVLSRR